MKLVTKLGSPVRPSARKGAKTASASERRQPAGSSEGGALPAVPWRALNSAEPAISAANWAMPAGRRHSARPCAARASGSAARPSRPR